MNRRLSLFSFDGLSCFVVLATMFAHAVFILNDTRVPGDPGLYYTSLPLAWERMANPVENFPTLFATLGESSGWYNLFLAAVMRVFGRSPETFRFVGMGWLLLCGLSCWWMARHMAGKAAGFAAVCLVFTMPLLLVTGRTAWIHIPEAGIVLLLTALWMRDPSLERRSTTLALALLGAMAISLRQSGLVWLGACVPFMAWHAWRRRAAWPRMGAVAVAWGVSLLVPLQNIRQYMAAKAESKERYTRFLDSLSGQVFHELGLPVLVVGGLGLLIHLRRRPSRLSPAAPVVLIWLVLPFLLWFQYRSGMDNFPMLGAALAIAAGCGFGRILPLGALLAGVAWLLIFVPQWMNPMTIQQVPWLARHVPAQGGANLLNYYRRWEEFGGRDLQQLVEATCPDPTARCMLLADQGLLRPYGEEAGALELFLLGLDTVELHELREPSRLLAGISFDAFANFNNCGDRELQWRERFPETMDNLRLVLEGQSMVPVWSRMIRQGCEFLWFTPEGEIAEPALLPNTGRFIAGGFTESRGESPEALFGGGHPGSDQGEHLRVTPGDLREGRLPGGEEPGSPGEEGAQQ